MDDELGEDFSEQEDEIMKKMRLPPKPLPKDYWIKFTRFFILKLLYCKRNQTLFHEVTSRSYSEGLVVESLAVFNQSVLQTVFVSS